jgi:hypothetical protein
MPKYYTLAIGFRFLASGDSLTSVSFVFRIGFSTAHLIVKEVCDALWIALAPIFLSVSSGYFVNYESVTDTIWNSTFY